jgi:hypothetical protein
MPNSVVARFSGRPESSSAAIVLSNVDGALTDVIAAISFRCASLAYRIDGLKSAVLILSNAGTPP